MSPRKEFLLALFRSLEERQVPYAVARNYDDIYENHSSDVDVTVEPEELNTFVECLRNAAVEADYLEVLYARYANYSWVYFHKTGGFLRIDVETETRWRIFPVLSAKAIIGLRRKHDQFYVPHPRHESVILLSASIWRGAVSERYRRQLSKLCVELNDPLQLRRSFNAIFGRAGELLADYQSNISSNSFPPLSFKTLRKALVRQAVSTGPNRRALFKNVLVDIRRLFERVLQPPGISLLFISSAKEKWDIHALLKRLEFLYPLEKTELNTVMESPRSATFTRWTCKQGLQRVWTLFKGGLFVRVYQANEEKLPALVKTHSRWSNPSATFICAQNANDEIVLIHAGTGFMDQLNARGDDVSRENKVIDFLTGTLNRTRIFSQLKRTGNTREQINGTFIVLLGLDGSGKTTIARQLCCLVSQTNQFQSISYFHWRPSLLSRRLFPLASTGITPRKIPQNPNLFRGLVSAVRLMKNLVLTNLAWRLNVRKLLARNSLIIIDRYFYNYYLDPVSVRYYGPRWLLDKVRPAFPKPDWIVILQAPPEVLLARKQELSEQEIRAQTVVLNQIASDSANSIVVDATRPPEEIAREILLRMTTPSVPAPNYSRSKF